MVSILIMKKSNLIIYLEKKVRDIVRNCIYTSFLFPKLK